ncbi:signal peptide protein [Streptomyces sp. NPDC005648]|uniref:signal peptide protein n=1 Tax=Streptomyces sp. NPDC005648 TaxID=3157044 RepID=UPI0033B2EE58
MPTKNRRLATAAALVLTVALAGVAGAGPALASTAPVAAASSTHVSAAPVDFVDLTAFPLPGAAHAHTFTLGYRNDSAADQIVAPQILLESPDAGPFLSPSDVGLERQKADGCWTAVQLGSQTGTLFTDLPTARRTLHPGETLTERYRLTVTNASVAGTVQPRIALYG